MKTNFKMKFILCVLCFSFFALEAFSATFKVFLQPIEVRLDDGSSAGAIDPNSTAFGDLMDVAIKIWDQADIELSFLTPVTYNDSSFQDVTVTAFGGTWQSLVENAGHGQHADANVINLWLVQHITADGGATQLAGRAEINGNGYVLSNSVNLDTVAHELGHNLLGDAQHNDFTDDPANKNLMAAGGVRVIPGSLSDIYPDGAGTDHLTGDQITTALNSPFVQDADYVPVPEPKGTILLCGLLLAGWAAVGRKMKKA